MKLRASIVLLGTCAVGSLMADDKIGGQPPCRYQWERVDVVSLASAEHRRIVPGGMTSASLVTRAAIGNIGREDYVLQVVVETRPRDTGQADGEQEQTPDGLRLEWCDSVVRQYSSERLADLDIVSSASIDEAYPAGSSLVDVFDISVELYLRDGMAPARIFNPRRVQTVSQYLDRRPRLPLVVNLRLNRSPAVQAAHRFDVLMHLTDGHTHSVKSPAVVIDP